MALISPGVEVTVIDESQYIPSAVNSVPYFLIATAQNKVSSDGVTVAAGTLAANANKTYLITSQRDLAATFGVPFFYNTTTGTPINGYELNEYGLLAAYSALGVTNRAYIQRADIDLTELTASLTRPAGQADSTVTWVDTASSKWGIQEWNRETNSFTVKTPLLITDSADLVDPLNGDYTPLSTIGSIGDYAITFYDPVFGGYYKNSSNNWVGIGSDAWKLSWPTVQGSATPTTLTLGANIYINGVLCSVGATNTVSGFATVINNLSILGVTAANVGGKLTIYADSDATNDGSTADGGIVSIQAGPNNGAALLTALGISAIEYGAPEYLPSYSYQSPRWRLTDTFTHPTGSIWNNLSSANNGLNVVLKLYNSTLGAWVAQSCPAYIDDVAALYGLAPTTGGSSIATNATYISYDALSNGSTVAEMQFVVYQRSAPGPTIITGNAVLTGTPFTVGNQFTLSATEAGSATTNTATVTIGGTGTASNFITAVSAANIPYVSASLNSDGYMVLTHSQGGTIYLNNITGQGTPIATAGFNSTVLGIHTNFQTANPPGGLVLSNWLNFPTITTQASTAAPTIDPANGTYWYYSTAVEADIMIQNNGAWVGYKNCANDVRGFNLNNTNAAGPIFATSAPTTQNNVAQSPLQYGDLWIDTNDLDNYPKIYRWQSIDSVDQWVAIDTADQVSQDGILFADARWATDGDTNPITDPIPSIVSLLTSNYLDLDAPNPALFPQGMLLWNTRRSGYNVKSFNSSYLTSTNFPTIPSWIPTQAYPSVSASWVTASGNRPDGAMYAGRLAQRQLVVNAMKSGLDTSIGAREDTTEFNLLATPGYPELMSNMVALSNERNNTVFVVGDTPMRLAASGSDIISWHNNNNGAGLATGDGLNTSSQYLATFWPSCQTNDLSGNTVVQPPSHMMVRTILRNDEVAYPWLAPAGTRRGVVDNASAIGYINSATGEFVQLGVNQGLRDVLYNVDINPITFVPGVGITNFGNKTTTIIDSALDRINVSRLIAFLRNRLNQIGKLYLFEPNDTITRNEITNTINSLMIDLIAKRAIYDYLVVCDLSNNTPSRIDRNELWVDIAIEPVKAVEFIYIPLRIKNTGEIAAGAGV
jgi:hypothetical protein